MEIRSWDGGEHELDAAAELYARVFTEPPYDEHPAESRSSFTERIHRYADSKPCFRLLLAWDAAELVGLVLGTGIGEGDWWRDRIVGQLPDAARGTWLRDECFSVAELAVAAAHRRQGIAGALMTAVLDRLPYTTAVLGCYAEAPARRFYAGQGWEEIATGVRIGSSPELCIFGRRTKRTETSI